MGLDSFKVLFKFFLSSIFLVQIISTSQAFPDRYRYTSSGDISYGKLLKKSVFDESEAAFENENMRSHFFRRASFKTDLKKLKVMFYNVENLFDTVHDTDQSGNDKRDWEFLPKSDKRKKAECLKITHNYFRIKCLTTDWVEEKLKLKINQVARVIESSGKELPDILGLSEIENDRVIRMLGERLGYEYFVTTSSSDKRGIDLTLLFRKKANLSYQDALYHRLVDEYFEDRPTRDILQVNFLLNGTQPISFFVNHWPSQGNPSSTRISAAEQLRAIVEDLIEEDQSRAVVMMGDFNTVPKEFPHPIEDELLYSDYLYDVHSLKTGKSPREHVGRRAKNGKPPGTYFYGRKKQWNVLDRFIVSDNLLKDDDLEFADKTNTNNISLNLNTYRIVYGRFMERLYTLKKSGKSFYVPKRYDFGTTSASKAGFSDHYPIYMELDLN